MNCKPIAYNIISTGSDGNAVVINDIILIDCGVSFKALHAYRDKIKLVLLTHIHSDHFNRTTVRKLAAERPTLRFGCGKWLAPALVDCGVNPANIDVLDAKTLYMYGKIGIQPEELVHNVPNQGYKIHFGTQSMFYATDTNSLDGISAKNYDLLMVEANYVTEEIKAKIAEKRANEQYAYEYEVMKNHLSKEKCDAFLEKNAGQHTVCVYLHCHKDKEVDV